MSRLTLIVAATTSNGIGQKGKLPWRLAKELTYFARVTTEAPEGQKNGVIMGRNTWESIPKKFRPLPRRVNVVISSNQSLELFSADDVRANNVQLASSLDSALEVLSQAATHRQFIIGGATLYTQSLTLPATSPGFVDRVLLTRILSPKFDDCDVFMPEFLAEKGKDGAVVWNRATDEELVDWVGGQVPHGEQEENGIMYEFQMWTRSA